MKNKKKNINKTKFLWFKNYEFSKKLTYCTGLIFAFNLLSIFVLSILNIDTSSFSSQSIITTGAIFGSTIVFYLNKSKIENLSKAKVKFLLLKLRLEIKLKDRIDEDSYDVVTDEIDKMNQIMDEKLDSVLNDSIQKDIDDIN